MMFYMTWTAAGCKVELVWTGLNRLQTLTSQWSLDPPPHTDQVNVRQVSLICIYYHWQNLSLNIWTQGRQSNRWVAWRRCGLPDISLSRLGDERDWRRYLGLLRCHVFSSQALGRLLIDSKTGKINVEIFLDHHFLSPIYRGYKLSWKQKLQEIFSCWTKIFKIWSKIKSGMTQAISY